MPIHFVRLALVRSENCRILLIRCQRDDISALRLQPFVKLILIQKPSSAGLGGRDGAVLQYHVHRSPGNVRVLDGLFHTHRLVAVFLCWFATLCLLSGQHGSHAHHLVPKLGDDLRRSLNVRISFSIFYHYFGDSAAKELNEAMLIPIIHDNPRIIMST